MMSSSVAVVVGALLCTVVFGPLSTAAQPMAMYYKKSTADVRSYIFSCRLYLHSLRSAERVVIETLVFTIQHNTIFIYYVDDNKRTNVHEMKIK